MLAAKGTDFSSFDEPKYGNAVMVHGDDPLVLFADSTSYHIRVPRSVFAKGEVFTSVRIALGLDGDVPALFLKNGHGVTPVALDTKIYSEDMTNEHE